MNHCLCVYAWEDTSRCGCSDNEGCDTIACTMSSASQEAVGYSRYPHGTGRDNGSSWEAYAPVEAANQQAVSRGRSTELSQRHLLELLFSRQVRQGDRSCFFAGE